MKPILQPLRLRKRSVGDLGGLARSSPATGKEPLEGGVSSTPSFDRCLNRLAGVYVRIVEVAYPLTAEINVLEVFSAILFCEST